MLTPFFLCLLKHTVRCHHAPSFIPSCRGLKAKTNLVPKLRKMLRSKDKHTHPHTHTYTNTPAQSNPSASVSGHGPNHSNATEDSTEASASLGLCSWSEQPCVLVLVMSLETDETAELLERPLSTRHSNFFCKTGPWRSVEQLNRSSFEMAKLDFCFDVSFGLRYLEKTCPCQVFFSWR